MIAALAETITGPKRGPTPRLQQRLEQIVPLPKAKQRFELLGKAS